MKNKYKINIKSQRKDKTVPMPLCEKRDTVH